MTMKAGTLIMRQGYKIPTNDFEVIEKFDSYEDDDLAVKMAEFYQGERDKGISLEDAYLRTLQIYSDLLKTSELINPSISDPVLGKKSLDASPTNQSILPHYLFLTLPCLKI